MIHHLNNMMQAGIVTITKTEPNTKNQLMKFYTAKSGMVVLPEKAFAKAKQSKSFSKSLKSIMKFAGIGIAGMVSWVLIPKHKFGLTDENGTVTNNDPNVIWIPLVVIILGLIVERIFVYFKK